VADTTRDARQAPAARDTKPNDAIDPAEAPEFETPTSRQVEPIDEESDLTTTAHTLGESGFNDASDADAVSADVEPSLNDQELLTDPTAAPGSGDSWEDPVEDGEEVYVPPSDPVITTGAHGDARVLNGFSEDATEESGSHRSSDGTVGDEAIADAVRTALRHDAATTDLEVDVAVERGIVRLFGAVSDLDDVENAESVAAGVPGVVEVVEELQVAGI
jgi:hypothetical protein